MKRSEINEHLREGARFIASHGFILPPFAFYSPNELLAKKNTLIFKNHMGWDVTDYGSGAFNEKGLFLFTVRNGNLADLTKGAGMLYAEKIMISRKNQYSPMHRHNLKVEDIINRGGGKLVLDLRPSAPDGTICRDAPTTVLVDGEPKTLAPNERLRLSPGESVTLPPSVWHAFWAEENDCLIGEVSTVNDDLTDNVFEEALGRFATVEEDVAPLHLLVSDYDAFIGKTPR